MSKQELLVDIDGVRQKIDMYDDEMVQLVFSIADIIDIGSRNASFSRTIKLPGSTRNRAAFSNISNLTSDNDFNPNLKSPAYILSDSVVIFEGNLQMKNVIPKYTVNSLDFEVVIYSLADGLFKSIGESYLTDIDLSDYAHTWNNTNITNSWTSSLANGYFYPLVDYGNSFTNLIVSSPLIETATGSGIYVTNSGVIGQQLYPGTYIKTILDTIFYENAYQYRSNFFESDFFRSLVLPFSNENLVGTDLINNDVLGFDVSDRSIGLTGASVSKALNYNGWRQGVIYDNTAFPASEWSAYAAASSFVFDSIIDTPGFISIVNGTPSYYINNSASYSFQSPFSSVDSIALACNKITKTFVYKNNTSFIYGFKPQININVNFNNYSFLPDGEFSIALNQFDVQWWRSFHPTNGTSSMRYLVAGRFNNSYTPLYPETTITSQDMNFGYSGLINATKIDATFGTDWTFAQDYSIALNLATYSSIDTNRVKFNSIGNYQVKFNDWRDTDGQLGGQRDSIWDPYRSIDNGFIYLQPGEETFVTMVFGLANNTDSGTDSDKYFTASNTTYELARFSGNNTLLNRNYISAQVQSETVFGSLIDLAPNLPKNVKQKDFLTNIFNLFNLYVEPIKDYNRVLKIETRNDFYNNGKIKDWTKKVDINQDINIQILAETQNRTNLLTYKEDRDYYNSIYKSDTNQVYGQYKHEIENDFINGEKKIESIFASTPMVNIPGCINFPIPIIAKELKPNLSQTITYGKMGSVPRILQRYIGAPNAYGGYDMLFNPNDTFIFNSTQYNYYPYIGHYDNPWIPTKDLNFGTLVGLYYDFSQRNLTSNNLYENYWRDYLDELSAVTSRIVTCNMFLTPEDIYNFYFGDTIFLSLGGEDSYYKVNSIDGYDPSGKSTCKVELLKSLDFQIPRTGTRYDVARDWGYRHRDEPISYGPPAPTTTTTTSTTTTTTTAAGQTNSIGYTYSNTSNQGLFSISRNGTLLVNLTTSGTGSIFAAHNDLMLIYVSATSSGTASSALYINNSGSVQSSQVKSASFSSVSFTYSVNNNGYIYATSSQQTTTTTSTTTTTTTAAPARLYTNTYVMSDSTSNGSGNLIISRITPGPPVTLISVSSGLGTWTASTNDLIQVYVAGFDVDPPSPNTGVAMSIAMPLLNVIYSNSGTFSGGGGITYSYYISSTSSVVSSAYGLS